MNPYFKKNINNLPVTRRKQTTVSWWMYVAMILGCVVAYGFIAAARYHFNAMELSFKSEELKRQRVQLEISQRKLALELEKRKAPQKLDMRAQAQGFSLPSTRATDGNQPTTLTD